MDGLNFSIAPQNPLPGMMQSLQFGQALGGIQNQRNMAARQAEKARLDAEAKSARDAQVAEGFKLIHENPTAENYAKLANMMPPDQAESIRKSFTMLDEVAQQNTLNEAANVFAAFKSGNIGVARNLLDEKIAAYENAGNRQAVEKTKALRAMMDTGPEGAQAVEDFFGITMTAMPGGKDAVDAIAKFGEEKRAEAAEPTVQAKRLTDLGFVKAQTRKTLAEARKYGLDSDKLVLEIENMKKALPPRIELSADAEKLVNSSVQEAAKANALASQYNQIANDFEKGVPSTGTAAQISEAWGKLFGTEKEPTALRQEYLRLRNSEVLKMLPPGAASEKDIELALASFPRETSSRENITKFLNNMAKWKSYEGAIESSKAEWIQQNGTLGTAKASMKVGNREVPKGARFTEFIQDYVPNTSVLGAGGTAGTTFGTVPAGGGSGSAATQRTETGDF